MKKTLLTLLAAGALAPAMAQMMTPFANSILVFGSVGYGTQRGEDNITSTTGGVSSSTDQPHIRTLNFSPGIGFHVAENFAIGAFVDLQGVKFDLDQNVGSGTASEIRSRYLNIGPFLRYNQPLGDRFFYFLQADFGYLSGKIRNTFTPTGATKFETEDDINGVNASLTPAFGIRMTNVSSLTFGVGSIGYDYRRTEFGQPAGAGFESESKTSTFVTDLGSQFNITLQLNFGGSAARSSREPGDDTRRPRREDSEDEDDDAPRRRRNRDMDEE